MQFQPVIQPLQSRSWWWIEFCLRLSARLGCHGTCKTDIKGVSRAIDPERTLFTPITTTKDKAQLIGATQCLVGIKNAGDLELITCRFIG